MRAGKSFDKDRFLKEAVGTDISANSHIRAPIDLGEPAADNVLYVEAAAGGDEVSLVAATAEHCQRRRAAMNTAIVSASPAAR